MAEADQSTTRLIVSAAAVNENDALPTVYAMHVVDSDPGLLLAARVGQLGWPSLWRSIVHPAAASSST
jgi:isopentenyldiphosphate isomerase